VNPIRIHCSVVRCFKLILVLAPDRTCEASISLFGMCPRIVNNTEKERGLWSAPAANIGWPIC
jgi:hypothetical protein